MSTVNDGSAIAKDPSDAQVIRYDWSEVLATSVAIAESTFAVTTVQAGDPSGTALSTDNASILSASPYNSQHTQVRIVSGAAGGIYRVGNTIVTDESPAQTFERSLTVIVENL